MQRIVENFLEMTRVESPTLAAHRDWCDLSDAIHAATEPIRDALTNHPLSLDGVSDMPLLRLDSRLLAQSLSNVLHNAALYTPEGSPIELRARLINHDLVLIVRDHGKGLQPGDEERVFAKFYRAPGSPTGGTGLGLAIARGLLRAQGGDITARNHPDGGAAFELRVPVETHPV
jgi:two-component system sensor histidine kinase KdpD